MISRRLTGRILHPYSDGVTDTLYLIDGHAQIYRAYYAPFGELTSPSGEPTKAVHVFWQMMLNLVRDRKPDYLAITLDVSDETTFRRKIYPEYKATRAAGDCCTSIRGGSAPAPPASKPPRKAPGKIRT